jgi:hypothetical protein
LKKEFKHILFTTIILLISSVNSFSQDWMLKSTSDFNYYYVKGAEKVLKEIDSSFKNELLELEKKLNYHVNQQIDVYVVLNPKKKNELEKQLNSDVPNNGGVIVLKSNTVILCVCETPKEVLTKFREIAAEVLINEMMTGGSFQDKLKSSNLIYLPDWVIPGLVEYLSSGWSVENDNLMRVVHDEYGLEKFNSIPTQYNKIKGASFWKYLTHLYGEDAMPTMLYMIRLTRKLHAASYYSFQVSIKDLYKGWNKYYDKAYAFDQQKPNPVQGINIDINLLYDLYVESEAKYYTLEQSWQGVALFENRVDTKKRRKLLLLKKGQVPLRKFSGSIQEANGKVFLYVNTDKGVGVYSLEHNLINFKHLNTPSISSINQSGGSIYGCESTALESKIFKIEEGKLINVFKDHGYINSFSIYKNKLAVYREIDNNSSITIYNLEGRDKVSSLNLDEYQCKQVLFADDSTVLFNANENGIWNGQLWQIGKDHSTKVTNYRSNIVYHQYDNEVFVEYLDRDIFSSLFITEHLPSNDFYKYNNIEAAFFSNEVLEIGVEVDSTKNNIGDSLQDYSFQSPVNPIYDFTLSNYDSLAKEALKRSRITDIDIMAPEVFKAERSEIALTNKQFANNSMAYKKGLSTIMPNNVNIKIGARLSNHLNTKAYEFNYKGLLQPGAHDVMFSYINSTINEFSIVALHRQRKVLRSDESYRVNNDAIQVNYKKGINSNLSWTSTAMVRWDQLTTLGIDNESLKDLNENQFITSITEQATYSAGVTKHNLWVDLKVEPAYSILESGWNISSKLAARYKYHVSDKIHLRMKLNAGTSIGPNPVYFVMGGVQQDILTKSFDRVYGSRKDPMLYEIIYGVRGFDANFRNGTTFITSNLDIEIDPINVFISRPIVSELISNFRIIPFADIGLTYYGKNIYDPSNNLNLNTISSSTGTIIVDVRAFKNPLISAMGVGVASRLYNYNIRLDYALGLEEKSISDRQFHFTFGFTL